jgi:Zinc finger, C3HC4 type (RING finger)
MVEQAVASGRSEPLRKAVDDVKRHKREKPLRKIWQRAIRSGNVQAAATCIQLGCNVAWPVRNGSKSALQYSAKQHNEALVYLLLLHDAPIGKAPQGWKSHSDIHHWLEFLGYVVGASVQTKEKANQQLRMAAKAEALPFNLQWVAPFAVCVAKQNVEHGVVAANLNKANLEGGIKHASNVLSSGSARCTASEWLAAAASISNTASNLENLLRAEAGAKLAITAATEEVAAARIRTTAAKRHAVAAAALRKTVALYDVRNSSGAWAAAVLCMVWWTGLSKRRLYDLPCHVVPLPPQRGKLRLLLLGMTGLLLVAELLWFAVMLRVTWAEAHKLYCADPESGCAAEQRAFYTTVLQLVLSQLLLERLAVGVLCASRWLLSKAGLTVLRLATRLDMPWLVSLAISPRTAAMSTAAARPAVLSTVAVALKLDTAAATVAAVLRLDRAATYLKVDRAVCTLQHIFSNSKATLINFSVVDAACEWEWDTAVVLRLLYTWLRSPQGVRVNVLATVKRRDRRALLQLYELCEAGSSDEHGADSSEGTASTSSSSSCARQCVSWLEARVIAVCELQTVADECHLADSKLVLRVLAAARAAISKQNSAAQCSKAVNKVAAANVSKVAITDTQAKGTTVTAKAISSASVAQSTGDNRLWQQLRNTWQKLCGAANKTRAKLTTERHRSSVADTAASEAGNEQQSGQYTCDSLHTADDRDSRCVKPATLAAHRTGEHPQSSSTAAANCSAAAEISSTTSAANNLVADGCVTDTVAPAASDAAVSQRASVRQRLSLAYRAFSTDCVQRAERKAEQLEQQLRKQETEHNAALQQCRDKAAAAAAAAAKQLKAVTEQLEELEERSVCVVCQHDPKRVLLQPCLHLCLCIKCSKSPKITECPLCRAAIDYKETVHLG